MKGRILQLTLLIVLAASLVLIGCSPADEPEPAQQEPAPVEEAPPEEEPTEEEPTPEPAPPPEVCGDPVDNKVCAVIPAGETIKIGFLGPVSGQFSFMGMDLSQAASLAVSDLGTIGDHTFELVNGDTLGTPLTAESASRDLVSDPTTVAVVGPTFSGVGEVVLPVFREARVPLITPTATGISARSTDIFNRSIYTEEMLGSYSAHFIYDVLGVDKIGIVNLPESLSEATAAKAVETFNTIGGMVVYQSTYDTVDAAVAELTTNAVPVLLYAGADPSVAANLAVGIKNSGLEVSLVISGDMTTKPEYLSAAGEAAEGTYTLSQKPAESEARLAFDAAYQAQFGASAEEMTGFSWYAYDAAAVLIEAVKQVAIETDDGTLYVPREALIEAVRGTENYQGISGTLTCDDGGECNTTGPTPLIFQGGEWIEVGS